MLKIGVGSRNPAKVNAVKEAFESMGFEIEVEGVDVESQVSEQPFSDDETIQGAINRANNVLMKVDKAFDYGVGLEGGVVETDYGTFLCNWGAVVDKEGNKGVGGGVRIQLPNYFIEKLHMGHELGDIIDQVTGLEDVKKKEGTIGILTNQHITRSQMFRDVVISAYARFLHRDLYDNDN